MPPWKGDNNDLNMVPWWAWLIVLGILFGLIPMLGWLNNG